MNVYAFRLIQACRDPLGVCRLALAIVVFSAIQFGVGWGGVNAEEPVVLFTGKVVDSETNEVLAARIYLQKDDGTWFHVRSANPDGSAVKYDVRRGESNEVHTTISADPFEVELPAGKYRIVVERGKEYHALTKDFEMGDQPQEMTLKLVRWIDMPARGWYSGETHSHRRLADTPNLILAEDLNVSFPLTYWVTDSEETPAANNKIREAAPKAELIKLDATHVIWPVNTEYEIFTVRGQRHTLGAVFVLNHRDVLTLKTPTVKPVAEFANQQNAFLELDKHNWPWSMMLVPTMHVHLFELSNNHIWRTKFLFGSWYPEYAADYMGVEKDADGNFTERGWIDFGFQNYYSLLNCGFPIQPTGGTASGVHPVPLGFGRAYVYLPDGFSYQAWVDGLKQGRSFVTTGPMLFATVNGKQPGTKFESKAGEPLTAELKIEVASAYPLDSLEVIVNGQVLRRIDAQSEKTEENSFRTRATLKENFDQSSWLAVRCFEKRPDERPRFAHTAPFHFQIAGKPLKPRREEIEYLMKRVADEIERHQGTLPPEAIDEFKEALQVYQRLAK